MPRRRPAQPAATRRPLQGTCAVSDLGRASGRAPGEAVLWGDPARAVSWASRASPKPEQRPRGAAELDKAVFHQVHAEARGLQTPMLPVSEVLVDPGQKAKHRLTCSAGLQGAAR